MAVSEQKVPGLLYSPLFHVFLVVLLTGFAYSNTFQVPMLFDDEGSIITNTVIQNLDNFLHNGTGYAFNPFRFVGYLSFALNYRFGGLELPGYHLVNLAIHILNALLVYALLRLTFRTPVLRGSRLAPRSALLALTVALFFACHPVQTQAVTYIVQRLTALATLFYLASLVCYANWRLARSGGRPLSRSLPWYLLCFLSALLAMKSKEIAFTLPMIILLYEIAFFGLPERRQFALMTPLLLTAAVIPLTLVNLQKPLGKLLAEVSTETIVGSSLSRGEYLCTQFSVIVTYIRLLLLPVGQNLDYDYPISHSLWDPRALFSLMLLLSLAAAALYCWRRAGAGRGGAPGTAGWSGPLPELRLVAFGIFWFFITISVESSVIPIADIIFEHRVYLPSVGFFAALATGCALLVTALAGRAGKAARLTLPAGAVVVLLLAGATYARNHVWRDWITIWQDTVAKSPNKARPHNILGIGYLNQKFYDDALPEIYTAIRLNPRYLQAYFNLGLAYKVLERPDEAVPMYQRALSLAVDDDKLIAHISNELAVSYVLLGNLPRAAETFASAVRYQPGNADYRKNLGHALRQLGRTDAAAAEFRTALSLRPQDPEIQAALQELKAGRVAGAGAP